MCFHLDGDDRQKQGQIAHIDNDSSNSSLGNLAFLCSDHHDALDSKRSQQKGLTAGEVKYAREQLHAYLGTIESKRSELKLYIDAGDASEELLVSAFVNLNMLFRALDGPGLRLVIGDEIENEGEPNE